MRGETIIFFDGHFWVALFSEEDCGKIVRVGRYIFGLEPTNAFLDEWTRQGMPGLQMMELKEGVNILKEKNSKRINPKRALREAKKEMEKMKGDFPKETLSQKAFRLAREENKKEKCSNRSAEKRKRLRDKFEKNQAKKKRKHRGK